MAGGVEEVAVVVERIVGVGVVWMVPEIVGVEGVADVVVVGAALWIVVVGFDCSVSSEYPARIADGSRNDADRTRTGQRREGYPVETVYRMNVPYKQYTRHTPLPPTGRLMPNGWYRPTAYCRAGGGIVIPAEYAGILSKSTTTYILASSEGSIV